MLCYHGFTLWPPSSAIHQERAAVVRGRPATPGPGPVDEVFAQIAHPAAELEENRPVARHPVTVQRARRETQMGRRLACVETDGLLGHLLLLLPVPGVRKDRVSWKTSEAEKGGAGDVSGP